MNIAKIESFLSLAENLNFTKAAEERYVSQPTMSAHISSLESELDVRLFARDKQKVELTPAGESLYKDFNEIVKLYYEAIDRAKSVELGGKHLKIGYHGPIDWISLPTILKEFGTAHPDIGISIQIGGFVQLLRQIINDTLDVAIIEATEVRDDPRLETQFLFREPLCVFTPKDHPFATGDRFWLSDFKDEKFIEVSDSYVSKNVARALDYFRAAGFDLSNVIRANNYEEAMSMVASGIGLAFFPASFRQKGAVTQVRLKDKSLCNENVLVWKKNNNSPAVRMLRDMFSKWKW